MVKATRNIGNYSDVEIAHKEIVKVENLPLPYVHYPNFYGIFFGFSERSDSQIYFCECNIPILKNYIQFNDKLFSMDFPQEFYSKYNQIALENLDIFQFKKKICHRCNLSTPTMRYCHEMYGSKFTQFHGWYINQTYLRLGIKFSHSAPNQYNDYCPTEIVELIEKLRELTELRNPLADRYTELLNAHKLTESSTIWEKIVPIDKESSKIKRRINKYVENVCRTEFGYRKIGEGWVSETQLFNILKKIFPQERIIRHHRPSWLENLEIDVFVPDLMLGFEYQGQQHYHPIKAWGGVKAFNELKIRDNRKKELCKNSGIKLIEIDYTEPLTEDYIRTKISLVQNDKV